MSNSLDLDQARQNVGPDLGPNFCKSYQQTTIVCKELTMISLGVEFVNVCLQLLFCETAKSFLLRKCMKAWPQIG